MCFVVGRGVEDEMCINALNQAVQQPLRRLFTLLSWENTMDKVQWHHFCMCCLLMFFLVHFIRKPTLYCYSLSTLL